jgi:hypothetical protein
LVKCIKRFFDKIFSGIISYLFILFLKLPPPTHTKKHFQNLFLKNLDTFAKMTFKPHGIFAILGIDVFTQTHVDFVRAKCRDSGDF